MARKPRKKAVSGIYHVILRGINKQDIFVDDNDFESMIRSLEFAKTERSANGKVLHNNCCKYYAYCILHNHLHILVQEGTLNISDIMKKLQDRFVSIYNRKYDRVGHLFQDRFKSEPVDDSVYFHRLLRYIHRNPVKALEADTPADYKYSSWREYLNAKTCIIKGSDPLMMQLCEVETVIEDYGYDELVAWVNEDVDDACMDMDTFVQPMSDSEAWERLKDISDVENVEYFKQLTPALQVEYISQLLDQGVTLRQASRLSSLSYRALWNRLHPEEYKAEMEKHKIARREKREQKFAEKKLHHQGV